MLLTSDTNYTDFKFWDLGLRQYGRGEDIVGEQEEVSLLATNSKNIKKALAFPESLTILN